MGGVDLDLLDLTLAELGEPPYRARQIWGWAAQGAARFDAMTNVPRRLRDALTATVPLSTFSESLSDDALLTSTLLRSSIFAMDFSSSLI